MELEQELDKLRDEVERWGRQNLGARIRHDLKGRMVVATKRAIAEGATASQVAEHLGVKPENLSRWLRVDATVVKVEGMLRELKVIGPETVEAKPGRRARAPLFKKTPPRLLLPGGIAVEGLDLEQLVTVLRCLR